jgi:hypothetical protein
MKTNSTMPTSITSPQGTKLMHTKHLTRLSALAATVMVAASCSLLPATDIDRVQPNYTSKDIFQGEWYSRALVVDKQYTNAWMFTGLEGNLERIRWEITRDSLRAFRSYEQVPGEEAEDIGEQTLVAEFAIESHFDIRRGYNPTNGVETNVIEENTVDRPWWERDYMRVNWSQNIAPYMPLFGIDLTDMVNNQSGAVINRSNALADPTEPFRVRVSNDYIETTVDVIMQPDVNTCWGLGVELYASCPGARGRIKYSFLKRDESHDLYEPMHYPDRVNEYYGLKENVFGDVNVCFENDPLEVTFTQDPAQQELDLVEGDDGVFPDERPAVPGVYTIKLNGGEFTFDASGNATVHDVCTNLADQVENSTFPVDVNRFGSRRRDGNNEPTGPLLCSGLLITPDERFTTPGRPPVMDVTLTQEGLEVVDGTGLTVAPRCELQELWTINGPFGEELCDPNIHNPDDCFEGTQSVFSNFGYFRTERFGYDRENGATLTSREQLINRWHIWEASTYSDGNPIPYEDRTPKSIVYYLNPGYPESMLDAALEQGQDWNEAFLDTIAQLQGKPVAQVEQDYADEEGNLFKGYEVRENDCNEANLAAYIESHADQRDLNMDLMTHGMDVNDLGPGNIETACAVVEHYSREAGFEDPFHWQQIGDLRYSFIIWHAKPEPAGPLGYGPSAADPVTGEIISGNANIYGASVDTFANWGGDIVQLLNGELSEEDIINGTHIREHVEQVRMRLSREIPRQVGVDMMNLFEERTGHLSDEEFLPRIPTHALNNNLERLAEAGIEREYLLTDEQVRLFGGRDAEPNAHFSEDQIQNALATSWGRASIPPLARDNQGVDAVLGANPNMTRNILEEYRERQDLFGRNNFCYFVDEMEPAIADLAYDLQGKTREQAVQLIRHNIMRGVLAHEVGHTIGLRHNFEGSADPLNYFPDYWEVETGTVIDSDNDRKEELAYSSIMDYHQRFNGDFGGIGLYDRAAVKFGYGKLIEVFDERNESFIPRDWANSLFLFYPDDLPFVLAGGGANEALNDKYDEVIDELFYNGNDQGFMDVKSLGIEPRAENMYKRRNVTLNDWRRQDTQRFFGVANDDGSPIAIDVPYSFCPDEFAWGGNLTCNRWDKGATSQEIVKNAIELYEFYYPFYTYMGARVGQGWANSYLNRLQDRFYQPLRNAFTYFYRFQRSTAQIWPFILDWSIAAHQGLNQYASVLQRPEPGTYCLDNAMYVPESDLAEGAACDQPLDIGIGQARPYETTYTDEEAFRISRVGHYWDKVIALNMMTSTDAFFYRDFSNQVDRSAFSISYYRVFQEEFMDLLVGMLMDDRSRFAPQVDVATGELVYTPMVNFRGQTPTPTVGPLIKPSSNFGLARFALFWSMAGFSSPLDQTLDLAQRAKIAIVGGQDDIDFTGDEIIFTDPKSGIQYRSFAHDGVEFSLGYQLLDDAKNLVEGDWATAEAALEAAEATQDTDPEGYLEALAEFSKQDRLLDEKISNIDMTRYITRVLESSDG